MKIITSLLIMVIFISCNGVRDKAGIETKDEMSSQVIRDYSICSKNLFKDTTLSVNRLYYEYSSEKIAVDSRPRYRVAGKIIDSTGYPAVLIIFGLAIRKGSMVDIGFDKCIHLNSNIGVFFPKPKNSFYYSGEHCCLENEITYAKNAFGVDVPVYWYDDCRSGSELENYQKQLEEQLHNLYYCYNKLEDKYLPVDNMGARSDKKMDSVIMFLEALTNADGDEAIRHVVPKKRNRGSYKTQKIDEYYSSITGANNITEHVL